MSFIQASIHQMIDVSGGWPVAAMVVGVVFGIGYTIKVILGR